MSTPIGAQFTAQAFVDAVLASGVKLSMDGRSAWRDNVFVERVWRSVTYGRAYLKAYDSVSQASVAIADYITWYNTQSGRFSLGVKTPDEVRIAGVPPLKIAV